MRSTRRLTARATFSYLLVLMAACLLLVASTKSAASPTTAHIALPNDIAVSGAHLWVANGDIDKNSTLDNSVSEFNVSDGSLVRVISLTHLTGALRAPNAIAARGSHVWIADLHSIIELDASSGKVVRVINAKARFHAFESPAALEAIAVSGAHVWVANLNTVIELSASNGSVLRVIRAKADRFNQPLEIVASGGRVWVINNVAGDSVSELNAVNGSLIRVINPGADLFTQFGMAASGSHLFVTNWQRHSIIEINAANGSLAHIINLRSISGDPSPKTIAFDDGHLWVTNDNSVLEITAAKGTLVRALRNPADGFDDPAAIYGNGAYVWVANSQGNSVTELKASNGSLVRVIK